MFTGGIMTTISSGHNVVYENKNLHHIQIVSINTPTLSLFNNFADALNKNNHLPYTVTVEQLLQVAYIQVAHIFEGEFIAGCTIKHCDGELAEIGYNNPLLELSLNLFLFLEYNTNYYSKDNNYSGRT